MHLQLVEFAAALTLGFRNGSLFLRGVFQALEELSMQVMVQLSGTACRMNIPAFKHNETASRRKSAEEGAEGKPWQLAGPCSAGCGWKREPGLTVGFLTAL